MKDKIYVLLPVHNRREVTRQFIDCLKVQTHTNWHLVLIDDGSQDGTAEMVLSEITNLTVIRGKGNWWWGGSLQQGYLWLKENNIPGDSFVLIINDDTTIDRDFLSIGIRLLSSRQKTLLLAYYFSKQDGRLIDSGVHIDWRNFALRQAKFPAEINCLSTRGLFLKVTDFFDVGGFYPWILPHYGSDYEFTIRARRKGFSLCTDERLRLYGDETTTGIRKIENIGFKDALGYMFSKRALHNPIFRSFYIMLACPIRYKLLNLCGVWKKAALTLVKSAIWDPRK